MTRTTEYPTCQCGETFRPRHINQVRCPKCIRKKTPHEPRKCIKCGEEFVPRHLLKTQCSKCDTRIKSTPTNEDAYDDKMFGEVGTWTRSKRWEALEFGIVKRAEQIRLSRKQKRKRLGKCGGKQWDMPQWMVGKGRLKPTARQAALEDARNEFDELAA